VKYFEIVQNGNNQISENISKDRILVKFNKLEKENSDGELLNIKNTDAL